MHAPACLLTKLGSYNMTKIETTLEEYKTCVLHPVQNIISNHVLESGHLETQFAKSAQGF